MSHARTSVAGLVVALAFFGAGCFGGSAVPATVVPTNAPTPAPQTSAPRVEGQRVSADGLWKAYETETDASGTVMVFEGPGVHREFTGYARPVDFAPTTTALFVYADQVNGNFALFTLGLSATSTPHQVTDVNLQSLPPEQRVTAHTPTPLPETALSWDGPILSYQDLDGNTIKVNVVTAETTKTR